MRVVQTVRGDRLLRKLDPTVRAQAVAALFAFSTNSASRSLNFEKLAGRDGIYSIRINRNFRIILRRTEAADTFEIEDIGPHDIYRRLGGDD